MTARRASAAVVFLLLCAAAAWAQAPPGPTKPSIIQAGMGVPVAAPLGPLGDNIGGSGGLLAHIGVGLGDSVVSVGFEGGFLLYGTESWKVNLGPVVPDLSDVNASVSTDNGMAQFHGRVRVQPRHGRWRPYLDGLFGLNYIFTTTQLDTPCYGSYCDSNGPSTTNLSDVVSSFGGGGGVSFDPGKPGRARLDVAVRYLRGGEGNYLHKGGISREDGVVVLDVHRSRTDLVVFYFGFVFGR